MTVIEEGESPTIERSNSQTTESQHITRGIGSLSLQNVATSALGFVFLAALLRLLPAADYGVYSALSVSVGIVAVVAPMGLQYAAAKYLADIQGGTELKSRAKKIIILSSITSLLAALIFALFAGELSLYFTKSLAWSSAFVVGGVWLFSSSFSSVLQGTVQGLKRYTSLAGMLFVARAAMLVITIAGLEATHNLFVSFYAWIIYFGMLVFWSVKILYGDLSKRTASAGERGSQSLGYRDLLKYSLPLGIAGIFYVLTTNVDLLVVGGDMSPTSLGIYNTTVTISNVLNFVLITPLVTALLPEASYRIRNSSEISKGMRLAIRFVVLLVLPASLLMAALSPQLLELFSGGTKFMSGSEPLQIIAVFYVFFGVQFVIYSILQAKGKTVEVFIISAITAAIILGLSVALVPELGLVGAAIARSVSAVVGMAAAWYIARGYLTKLDNTGFYVRASLASIIPFVVVLGLTTFSSHSVWTIVPYTLFGTLIFLGCLLGLKVLSAEDRSFFASVLPSFIRGRLPSFLKQES